VIKIKAITIRQIQGDRDQLVTEEIAEEKPLTIYLNEQEIITILCSPGHEDELAVGFLLAEGLLYEESLVEQVKIDPDQGLAWVTAQKVNRLGRDTWKKRYLTTGCGGGTTAFYNLMDLKQCRPLSLRENMITPHEARGLMQLMQKKAQLYKKTHGVHSAALFTTQEMVVFREDVGRHNAIDKIAGYCFLNGIAPDEKILASSGRISSEMLLKAVRLQVPIILSRSAPTSLAVDLAQELRLTLIGFIRGNLLKIYTFPQRVSAADQ